MQAPRPPNAPGALVLMPTDVVGDVTQGVSEVLQDI